MIPTISSSELHKLTARLERASIPEPNSGCTLWMKTLAVGYGQISWRGRLIGAHRLAWIINRGPIPSGLFVCHKCDVPSCINPAHLFLGTARENNADKHTKGRTRVGRGSCQGSAKLTEFQILAIRNDGRLQREIAEEYGVDQSNISLIKKRLGWAHIP